MTDLSLKPCPFCGGKAELIQERSSSRSPVWAAECQENECGATTFTSFDRDEAIARWNRRKGGSSDRA